MSENLIVRHCAPTLAGLKTASIFSCSYETEGELMDEIKEKNNELNSRGVYFDLMRARGGKALVMVYRKKMLKKILSDGETKEFLAKYEYIDFEMDSCIERLKWRLDDFDFPHEIGVFLGYPLCDVKGFIENNGENFVCSGCWKGYGDADTASKRFSLIKKCSSLYCRKLEEGKSMQKLTVAI